MRGRFHLALGVADLAASIADYSAWLGLEPECVVPGAYALWRTEGLNLSTRVVSGGRLCAGSLVRTSTELVVGMLLEWRLSRELDPATGYPEQWISPRTPD